MFEDFLKNCSMEDEIKPSKKRVRKNIAALDSLIETEEKNVTKRKFRLKPLIIAAVIAILSGVSLLSACAAIQETAVRFSFSMGGEEMEGGYSDYVDSRGYRHITFSTVLPMDEENFAVIIDVDAPQGENVRVLTDEPYRDLMEKIRMYHEANNDHFREYGTHPCQHDGISFEDFGIVLKDSEFCEYEWSERTDEYVQSGGGGFGGKVMRTGAAALKKSSSGGQYYDYDYENNTKTFTVKYNYYVGKEQTE